MTNSKTHTTNAWGRASIETMDAFKTPWTVHAQHENIWLPTGVTLDKGSRRYGLGKIMEQFQSGRRHFFAKRRLHTAHQQFTALLSVCIRAALFTRTLCFGHSTRHYDGPRSVENRPVCQEGKIGSTLAAPSFW